MQPNRSEPVSLSNSQSLMIIPFCANGRIVFLPKFPFSREREREMRKRKEKPECSEPEVVAEGKEGDEDEESGNEGNGFFSCYLLTSVCPRYKGHTYIGFTVNPKRRIRQHNGEIGCGAWRTKRKRPWEMVLCIYGFPTNVSALQFEWAWQHPNESLAVRSAAASFKSLSGVANKVKLAYTMLTLPSWSSLNITVNYFSTKYMKNAAGCPSLPEHMKVQVSPINELPCYSEGDQGVLENEDDWEYNREYEEICSFRAYGSWQKEVSSEIPQKSIDEQTGADENFDKELEDDEQVPPSCTWSDIVAGTGTSETEFIIEDREERQSEVCMNLQQLREKHLASEIRTETSKLSSCNNGRPSEYEVIVIDVSTPSPPDHRTSSHRFKSRVTTSVRSEIIDLTKSSPTFIQL